MTTNEGRMDNMIMAQALLAQHLEAIAADNVKQGMKDPNPTIKDIEKSHLLYVVAHYKPFVSFGMEYYKVSKSSPTIPTSGISTVDCDIPLVGDFFADAGVYVTLSSVWTDSGTGAELDQVRWCDFPGERLFSRVEFNVNGTKLDEYTAEAVVMNRQCHLPENKRLCYFRCMGQELPNNAFVDELSTATATALPQARYSLNVFTGNQTPKAPATGSTVSLSLFIPLYFWFNRDPRLAFCSAAIPSGNRRISMDLCVANQLINTFVRGSSVTGSASTPVVGSFVLYINNIFVQSQVHDIFMARIGSSLIRIHKIHTYTINTASDESLLSSLKFPIEYMKCGLRPTANITIPTDTSRRTYLDAWHRFTQVTNTSLSVNLSNSASTPAQATCSYYVYSPTITNLSLTIQGVQFYIDTPREFFNNYIPLTYGGYQVSAPTDEGVCFITFALYPGTYQPSGHINISRAREIYLKVNSPYTSSNTPADMIVVASAINFLLITDGNASLRFAT